MNARELQVLAFRVREARALGTALELGVLDAIGTAKRPASELARALRCDERGLRILLDALVALGIVERAADAYALAPQIADAVLPGGAGTLRNLLLHDLWNGPTWEALGRAVRDGAAPAAGPINRHLRDPEILRGFLDNYARAMEQGLPELWPVLARRIAALRPTHIVDLGGGSGSVLLALLPLLPAARATLLDHPFALSRARERLEATQLACRVELRAADLEEDPLPAGADVLVLCRVLMGLSPPRARALIARCADALPPQGRLVVHDFTADSRVGALLSLDMLLHTGGEVPQAPQLREWLEEAGMHVERTLPGPLSCMHTWIASRADAPARRTA
jgi:SAM-dependent methyltransferase